MLEGVELAHVLLELLVVHHHFISIFDINIITVFLVGIKSQLILLLYTQKLFEGDSLIAGLVLLFMGCLGDCHLGRRRGDCTSWLRVFI